jgi:hypothetical protein
MLVSRGESLVIHTRPGRARAWAPQRWKNLKMKTAWPDRKLKRDPKGLHCFHVIKWHSRTAQKHSNTKCAVLHKAKVTAQLLIISKNWKQGKCTPTGERMNKLRCGYTMEYYSAL